MENQIKVHCGTPMVGTLMFSGSEYYCIKCGQSQGIFGPAFSVPETKELLEELEVNREAFHQIADACIPAGCRFAKCKKCEGGQYHSVHASNTDLKKSEEAYKLLAGGILEEETNAAH